MIRCRIPSDLIKDDILYLMSQLEFKFDCELSLYEYYDSMEGYELGDLKLLKVKGDNFIVKATDYYKLQKLLFHKLRTSNSTDINVTVNTD